MADGEVIVDDGDDRARLRPLRATDGEQRADDDERRQRTKERQRRLHLKKGGCLKNLSAPARRMFPRPGSPRPITSVQPLHKISKFVFFLLFIMMYGDK